MVLLGEQIRAPVTADTKKAYTEAVQYIGDAAHSLRGADYYDYLDELAGHIDALKAGYREEHPEDFE